MGCQSSSAKQVWPQSDPLNQDVSFHHDYLLLKKLGKGASAQVYAVKCVSKGLQVGDKALAAKILDLRAKDRKPKQPAEGEEGDRERGSAERTAERIDKLKKNEVVKEIKILMTIGESDSCIWLADSSVESPFAYLVMEQAVCTTLRYFERKAELNELVFARVLAQMLQGLIHAHSVSIVHRDVKPDNFLCFGQKATVKLCDFGLAEYCVEELPALTGIFGTAPYMSPEMLSRSVYGAKTDVWSLAVIAYVLLFGHFPYQPVERNSRAMKAAVLAGVPPPKFKPRLAAGTSLSISDLAQDFVKQTMVRTPSERPSASEALQHPWLQKGLSPSSQKESLPSMRSMLFAAKREGVFDVRQDQIEKEWTPIDQELSLLQDRAHGEQCLYRREMHGKDDKTFSSSSTRSPAPDEKDSERPGGARTSCSSAASSNQVSETSKFIRGANHQAPSRLKPGAAAQSPRSPKVVAEGA